MLSMLQQSPLPMRPMRSLSDMLFSGDSFFDDLFNFPLATHEHRPTGPTASCRALENAIAIELEVPRFRKEHITVDADPESGRLVIGGKRDVSSREEHAHIHSSGLSVPSFRRAFVLDPRIYDLRKVTSNVEDGVLTLMIPYIKEEQSLLAGASSDEASSIPVHHAAPSPQGGEAAQGEEKPKTELMKRDESTVGFHWPPKLEVVPKSEHGPLTFTITMPEGVTDPKVTVNMIKDGLLGVHVQYTQRRESDSGFAEQHGSFTRTFPLPPGTTKDALDAKMEEGKLVIVVKEGQQGS